MKPSPLAADLLVTMRQHPGFRELISLVDRPRLSRFKRTDTADATAAHARWAFESGQVAQHEQWLAILTGEPPAEQE